MSMQESIDSVKKNLPEGITVRVYIERGLAYAFVQWTDGRVRNIDMDQRLPIEDQLLLALDIATGGKRTLKG